MGKDDNVDTTNSIKLLQEANNIIEKSEKLSETLRRRVSRKKLIINAIARSIGLYLIGSLILSIYLHQTGQYTQQIGIWLYVVSGIMGGVSLLFAQPGAVDEITDCQFSDRQLSDARHELEGIITNIEPIEMPRLADFISKNKRLIDTTKAKYGINGANDTPPIPSD